MEGIRIELIERRAFKGRLKVKHRYNIIVDDEVIYTLSCHDYPLVDDNNAFIGMDYIINIKTEKNGYFDISTQYDPIMDGNDYITHFVIYPNPSQLSCKDMDREQIFQNIDDFKHKYEIAYRVIDAIKDMF